MAIQEDNICHGQPEVFLGKLARLLLAVTLVTCIILGFGRVLAHIVAGIFEPKRG